MYSIHTCMYIYIYRTNPGLMARNNARRKQTRTELWLLWTSQALPSSKSRSSDRRSWTAEAAKRDSSSFTNSFCYDLPLSICFVCVVVRGLLNCVLLRKPFLGQLPARLAKVCSGLRAQARSTPHGNILYGEIQDLACTSAQTAAHD